MNNLSDIFTEHKKAIVDFIDGVRTEAYKQGRADERAKIIAIVKKLKDSVPVNRVLDDIIKDKPKELGMLIAYDNILKELEE